MTNTNPLNILAQGLKEEFAEKLYADERFTELLHDLAAAYVVEKLPAFEDTDDHFDLACLLLETVKVSSW